MLQTQASPLMQFVPFILIIVIFYLMLIRPQKKQEQERQKMIAALKKNDEVVTNSGIHATVVNVKEKTLILRIDENVKMEVEKGCIAYVKKPQGGVEGS